MAGSRAAVLGRWHIYKFSGAWWACAYVTGEFFECETWAEAYGVAYVEAGKTLV